MWKNWELFCWRKSSCFTRAACALSQLYDFSYARTFLVQVVYMENWATSVVGQHEITECSWRMPGKFFTFIRIRRTGITIMPKPHSLTLNYIRHIIFIEFHCATIKVYYVTTMSCNNTVNNILKVSTKKPLIIYRYWDLSTFSLIKGVSSIQKLLLRLHKWSLI